MPTRRVPSTGGVEVAVYDLGGDGPPLLLSHATGFHGHVWLPIAALLAGSFHCYAFDQRAHGDTRTPPNLELAWEGIGDDAYATIDALGLDRPYGVGHSSGAAALFLAEGNHAGTFRGLFCFEPIVLPVDPPFGRNEDNPLSVSALKRRDEFPSRDAAYENYRAKPPFSVLAPEALHAYVDYGFDDLPGGGVRLKCRPEHEAEMYRMGSAHGAYALFPSITCPVTLAYGERTDAIGAEVIAQQAAALPRVRTHALRELGHFGPLEDPAAVAAAVVQAFAEG